MQHIFHALLVGLLLLGIPAQAQDKQVFGDPIQVLIPGMLVCERKISVTTAMQSAYNPEDGFNLDRLPRDCRFLKSKRPEGGRVWIVSLQDFQSFVLYEITPDPLSDEIWFMFLVSTQV